MKASVKAESDQADGCCGLCLSSHDGFEDGDAGAFAADECAGNVESVFRKELVEVVAGDAAGDIGEALADEVAVSGRAGA